MSNTPTSARSNVKIPQIETKVTNPMKNNIIITTINVNGLKNKKKIISKLFSKKTMLTSLVCRKWVPT